MFGKLHRSRKVDFNCPYCGHLQQEPGILISSFCRSCGEYFRARNGVAMANPGLKVSGIAEIRPNKPTKTLTFPPAGVKEESAGGTAGIALRHESWLVTAGETESEGLALTRPSNEEPGEAIGLSAGAFFGFLKEEEATSAPDDETAPAIGGKAHARDSLARGSIAALIQSGEPSVVGGKDRMPPDYVAPEVRRKTGDAVTGDHVRCYRCYHVQMVSRFAKSTQCERCSVYISLANYEIKAVKSHTLQTRGDVSITKKGGLINNSEIACHHLTVSGEIDATVDCSGEAVFRHSGVVRGKLFCERLVIEKNCAVRFPDGVMTERADINGQLIGNLTCSGKVRLARTGIIEGNLTAVDLETKKGGCVSGETVIDMETKTGLSLKKGFDPTIIS